MARRKKCDLFSGLCDVDLGYFDVLVSNPPYISEGQFGELAAEIREHEPKIALSDITHLITVSCTGLAAPGLEIELSEYLKLAPEISRFGVNFIGCYASFHALKMADDICRSR